jgi:hypothetical protein
MFLKEKRGGQIKGWGCANGRKQCIYKTKAETNLPTVSVEALFLTCMINAQEERDVATLDIPAAFMQADIDEEVHILFEGELVDLLLLADGSFEQFVAYERGKKVIDALLNLLNKVLYGTVQSPLLFGSSSPISC